MTKIKQLKSYNGHSGHINWEILMNEEKKDKQKDGSNDPSSNSDIKQHYLRIVQSYDEENNEDHLVVTDALRNLSRIAREESDPLSAWEYSQKVLNIDEKLLGPENSTVSADLNDLASVFQELGDMGGAREHYEKALKIAESVEGSDNATVATILNN